MKERLIIEGVDFYVLESQRHALYRTIDLAETRDDADLLEGLYNMLEEWSDDLYHSGRSLKRSLNHD